MQGNAYIYMRMHRDIDIHIHSYIYIYILCDGRFTIRRAKKVEGNIKKRKKITEIKKIQLYYY